MRTILALLLSLTMSSAFAQNFVVAPNGKATQRTTYSYVPPAAAKIGSATSHADVGAACDCASAKITNGPSTYCAVSGVTPMQLTICAVPVVVLPTTGNMILNWTAPTNSSMASAWSKLGHYTIMYGPSAITTLLPVPGGAAAKTMTVPNLKAGNWVVQVMAYGTNGIAIEHSVSQTVAVPAGGSVTVPAAFASQGGCGIVVGPPADGCSAGQATLSWVAPMTKADGSTPVDIAGYNVWYGRVSGSYTEHFTVAKDAPLKVTLSGLTEGTWYFAVEAFDSGNNTSEKSLEVSKTIVSGTNAGIALVFPDIPPPVVVPPPGIPVDHTGMGPMVDKSKYAVVDPANKYTTNRTASVYNYAGPGPLWWYPCIEGSRPDCEAAAGNIAHQNLDDIGAFREVMNFAGMSNDDPIVYPGQQGKAHSHTFFGNFVDYNTTSANIRDRCKWSASAGGLLNCTSVWIPTVVDTLDGTPVVPSGMNFYYKGSYEFPPAEGKKIVPVPVGLHMVSGDAKNVDPAGATNARYICMGPHGENPGWKPTITAAVADGTCLPGGDFMISVNFPDCWDGVNLDSPNHISHMAGVVQAQTPPYAKSCPASHPVQIPTLSVNAHYPIIAIGQVGRWRLSSDMYDPALPAGLSGHGDYMMGWDPTPHPELWGENKSIVEMWTTHCLNEQRDCHNFLLGDNRTMLY